jgi:hypothetical protein
MEQAVTGSHREARQEALARFDHLASIAGGAGEITVHYVEKAKEHTLKKLLREYAESPDAYLIASSVNAAGYSALVDWKWTKVRPGLYLSPLNELVRYIDGIKPLRDLPKPVRIYLGEKWWMHPDSHRLEFLETVGQAVLVRP